MSDVLHNTSVFVSRCDRLRTGSQPNAGLGCVVAVEEVQRLEGAFFVRGRRLCGYWFACAVENLPFGCGMFLMKCGGANEPWVKTKRWGATRSVPTGSDRPTKTRRNCERPHAATKRWAGSA